MTHRDVWLLLDQFLDGALPARARWSVAAHLGECPTCRAFVTEQARLRGAVHDHLMATGSPDDLPDRLKTALAREDRSPAAQSAGQELNRRVRWVAALGPALAAVWLLVQVASPIAGTASPLPGELATAHALFAHDESMLDVAGDAATVREWLRQEADLDVAPPELHGYELIGSRLLVLNGKPAAQLVYESRPGDAYLSLLHYDDRTGQRGAERFATATAGAMSVVSWADQHRRNALVAALPDAELRRIAAELADTETGSP